MKRARRFKRVATETSKRPILSNRLKADDAEPPPSQPSHSLTTAVVKPRSDSFPIPEIPSPKMTILPYTFFQIDALDLAPRLLGKFLRRDDVVLQITEVVISLLYFSFRNFPSSVCFRWNVGKVEEIAVSNGNFEIIWTVVLCQKSSKSW